MPGAGVVTERPPKPRDSPTFRTYLGKELLTETQTTNALDVDLLCNVRQFVFPRYVIAGDVPSIGTLRLTFCLWRRRDGTLNNEDENQHERRLRITHNHTLPSFDLRNLRNLWINDLDLR